MSGSLHTKVVRGAKRAAWTVTWSLTGVLLLTVGAGFLTVAAWLFLSSLRDPQFAALVIGLAYFGAGLIAVAIAKTSPRHSPGRLETPPPPSLHEQMAMAFAKGFRTGKTMRK